MSKGKILAGLAAAVGLGFLFWPKKSSAKQLVVVDVPPTPDVVIDERPAAQAEPKKAAKKKTAPKPTAAPAVDAAEAERAILAAQGLTQIEDYARDIRILAAGIKAATDTGRGDVAKSLDDKRKQLEADWRAAQGGAGGDY